MNYMETERTIIEHVLQDAFGGKHMVRVLPAPYSFRTSQMHVFFVQFARAADPGKLPKVEAKINERLTWHYRTSRLVRIVPGPPARIEVQRPDPHHVSVKPVLHSVSKAGGERPLVLLGETHDFSSMDGHARKMIPMVVDLSRSTSPHILLAAMTGAGKTKLLQGMIAGLTVMSDPSQVSLVVLDPKGLDYRALNKVTTGPSSGHRGRVPHMAADVLTDHADIVAAMEEVSAEVQRRLDAFSRIPNTVPTDKAIASLGSRIVVVVDELAEIVANDKTGKFAAAVRRIAQIGRQAKVSLILATQKPTNAFIEEIGKDKANLPVRICGRTATPEDAKAITGIKGSVIRADLLPMGDFFLVNGSVPERFHAFWLEDGDVLPAFGGITRLWTQAGKSAGWTLGDITARSIHAERENEEGAAKAAASSAAQKGRRRAEINEERRHLIEQVASNLNSSTTPQDVVNWFSASTGRGLNYNTAAKILDAARQFRGKVQ